VVFDVSLALGDRLVYTEFDADGEVIHWGHESFRGEAVTGSCPVTYPLDSPFTPPPPRLDPGMGSPPSGANPGIVYAWYGSEDLWTYVPIDGTHNIDRQTVTKGPFWSANFPGGRVEGEPEISVTMRRLDGVGEWANNGRGTNAYTEPDGWFMFAGHTLELGCWEVTATYKGATLTYVYEN